MEASYTRTTGTGTGPTNCVTVSYREMQNAVSTKSQCSEMEKKRTKEGRRRLILLQKSVTFPANFSGNKKTRKVRSKSWCKKYKKR